MDLFQNEENQEPNVQREEDSVVRREDGEQCEDSEPAGVVDAGADVGNITNESASYNEVVAEDGRGVPAESSLQDENEEEQDANASIQKEEESAVEREEKEEAEEEQSEGTKPAAAAGRKDAALASAGGVVADADSGAEADTNELTKEDVNVETALEEERKKEAITDKKETLVENALPQEEETRSSLRAG